MTTEQIKVVGKKAGEVIGELRLADGSTYNVVLNTDEHIGHDIVINSTPGGDAWLFCHYVDGRGCGHILPALDWNAEAQYLTN